MFRGLFEHLPGCIFALLLLRSIFSINFRGRKKARRRKMRLAAFKHGDIEKFMRAGCFAGLLADFPLP